MLTRTIGQAIRQRRKALGLSIEQLAEACHPKHLSMLEAGRAANPTVATLEAIARRLGCRVTDFFEAEPAATTPPAPRPLTKREKRILDATAKLPAAELRLLLKLASYMEPGENRR